MCHPRVTKMYDYIQHKNLTYFLEDIKKVTSEYPVCCEIKQILQFVKSCYSKSIFLERPDAQASNCKGLTLV